MEPRITINLTAGGELKIWLNPAGRDLLVRELQALSETNEHFHLAPSEVQLSSQAYRPTDTVFEYGKVLCRPDEWDRLYFPHVIDEPG